MNLINAVSIILNTILLVKFATLTPIALKNSEEPNGELKIKSIISSEGENVNVVNTITKQVNIKQTGDSIVNPQNPDDCDLVVYDERQNGTENYRISVDGVVVILAEQGVLDDAALLSSLGIFAGSEGMPPVVEPIDPVEEENPVYVSHPSGPPPEHNNPLTSTTTRRPVSDFNSLYHTLTGEYAADGSGGKKKFVVQKKLNRPAIAKFLLPLLNVGSLTREKSKHQRSIFLLE